jgi:hypothetical protein
MYHLRILTLLELTHIAVLQNKSIMKIYVSKLPEGACAKPPANFAGLG